MILNTGPIAPSSLGLWAVTFILGGLVVGFAWLVRRHYQIAVPVYTRVFGDDSDTTDGGHLANSEERFDSLDDATDDIASEVDGLHADVRKLERRQDAVLSNQKAIAEAVGADLERPRIYRAGRPAKDRNRDRDDD